MTAPERGPTLMEAGLQNIAGVLSAARALPDWAARLDPTEAGARQSLVAAVMALPFIVLVQESARRFVPPPEAGTPVLSPFIGVLGEVVVAYAAWGVALLLLVALARRKGEPWRIPLVVVAQNWANIFAYALLAPAMGAGAMTGSLGLVQLSLLTILMFSVWLDWGILRRPLGLTPGQGMMALIVIQIVTYLAGSLIDQVWHAVFAEAPVVSSGLAEPVLDEPA